MHVTEREREKERERERRKTECVKDADANGIAERAEEGGIRSRHSSNSRDPMLHYLNARSVGQTCLSRFAKAPVHYLNPFGRAMFKRRAESERCKR